MAEKHKSLDKKMLTFTVPSHIQGKTIKKGRYTKLQYLLELRAYLSKCFNNTDGIKYFMNIELGKAHSNPHLHIQLWVSPATSSHTIDLIKKKAISKFDLEEKRCPTTHPAHDIDIYSYVIKDYAKGLSDKEIWDLEIQKKRMRDQLGSKVRFYSKSGDKYTQKIYGIFYRYYNVARRYANEFIEKFIGMFFNKTPQPKVLEYWFSKLRGYRTRKSTDHFPDVGNMVFDVLYACRDPPLLYMPYSLL
jgi:hypothetical protein